MLRELRDCCYREEPATTDIHCVRDDSAHRPIVTLLLLFGSCSSFSKPVADTELAVLVTPSSPYSSLAIEDQGVLAPARYLLHLHRRAPTILRCSCFRALLLLLCWRRYPSVNAKVVTRASACTLARSHREFGRLCGLVGAWCTALAKTVRSPHCQRTLARYCSSVVHSGYHAHARLVVAVAPTTAVVTAVVTAAANAAVAGSTALLYRQCRYGRGWEYLRKCSSRVAPALAMAV
jgi:hypothetical protein